MRIWLNCIMPPKSLPSWYLSGRLIKPCPRLLNRLPVDVVLPKLVIGVVDRRLFFWSRPVSMRGLMIFTLVVSLKFRLTALPFHLSFSYSVFLLSVSASLDSSLSTVLLFSFLYVSNKAWYSCSFISLSCFSF